MPEVIRTVARCQNGKQDALLDSHKRQGVIIAGGKLPVQAAARSDALRTVNSAHSYLVCGPAPLDRVGQPTRDAGQVCAGPVSAMVRNVIETRRWRLVLWPFQVSERRFAMP